MRLYAWVDIGCLECHNPTVYRGLYGTLEEARDAVSAARRGPPAPVLEVGVEDDDIWKWGGNAMDVVIALDIPTVSER